MIDRTDVLALFSAQFWVAEISQLKAAGVSPRTITRARQRGTIVGVLPGVVRLAGSPDTFKSRGMALQLHAGDDAFLSGVTAAVLHGLRQMPRSIVEITVREDRPVCLPAWGRQTQTSWIEVERDVMTRPDGLRVATPLRMLFRLARTFNDHRFERAAEDVWHLGLATPADAADYLAAIRRQGKWGVTRFERWLEKTAVRARPSQSGLELDVLDAVRRAGLPEPERQYPLTLRSGELIHVDLAWPRARLGVEPGHTWWHGGNLGKRADDSRDRACDEIGWRIVRHDESFNESPAEFGLQVWIIHDERMRSLRPA